ncbi:MAG: hypothetical protein WC278_00720 [Bacilli bacterium]
MREKDLNKQRSRWTKKFFKKRINKVSRQYAELINEDYKKVIKRAETLLRIEKIDYPFEAPIMITLPDSFSKDVKVRFTYGESEDKKMNLYYDQSLVTSLFFGEQSLFFHRCNVDHTTGNIGYDVAGELNYADIVYAQTTFRYDTQNKLHQYQLVVELSLLDGTIVPLYLRNHTIHDNYGGLDTVLTEQEEYILDTIKGYIRASKE